MFHPELDRKGPEMRRFKARWAGLLSLLLAVSGSWNGDRPLAAADCNGNAVDDDLDAVRPSFGFHGRASYFVQGEPYFLIDADLNGDGKLDLATANALSDDVSVLFNQGDGTFRAALR
ncbi:MAG: FG-GAP repeat domain-containing protein, partial [Thermoanaerobaculia bacterium]